MADKMRGFAGFPAGRLPTTPVPNLFFSELLPAIDHLAELKVTLHLFWLIGKKAGELRYARLDELLADDHLLAGLPKTSMAAEEALMDGLERAVARGTLLHYTVRRPGGAEEWYMVNSPAGREVVDRLLRGELDLEIDSAEDIQLQMERPTVFVLYEQNIGLLTPMIADELRDAEKDYPLDWIEDALREAVLNNKRSWRYTRSILERWRVEGHEPSGGSKPSMRETDRPGTGYRVPEGYEDLIEH
jgi:DnaD/phage-associated family protein